MIISTDPQTLVLSGSGPKYHAQLAAVRELVRVFVALRFERFVGTSGGAMLAALLASGMTLDKAEAIADSINPAELLDGGFGRLASSILFGHRGMPKSLHSGDKILAELRKHLPKTLGEVKHPLHIVTCDIETGDTVIWTNEKNVPGTRYAPTLDLPFVVMCSMALPVIFDSRRIRLDDKDQGFFCDGGVGNNFAIDLMSEGRNCIGIRFQSSRKKRIIRNIVDIIMAVIDIMIESTTRKHMSDAAYANTIVIKSDDAVTDFNVDAADRMRLKAQGKAAVHEWLARVPAEKAAARGAALGVV